MLPPAGEQPGAHWSHARAWATAKTVAAKTGRRGHIIDTAVILILLATIPIGWWSSRVVSHRAEQAATTAAYDHLDADAAATNLFLRHMISDGDVLRRLAQRWIQLQGPAGDAHRGEIHISLRNLLRLSHFPIAHLTISDAAGRVVWHDSDEDRPDITARPHFMPLLRGARGPLVTTPVVRQVSGKVVVPFSWRLVDGANNFIGAVIVQYDPAGLSAGLAEISGRPGSVIALLNTEGALLARSAYAPERIGDIVTPPENLARLRDTGRERLRAPDMNSGHPMLLTARLATEADLVIIAATELGTVMAPVRQTELLATLIAGSYTLLVFLAIWIGYGVLRSRRLQREMAMLRAGRAEVERLHTKLPAVLFVRDVAPDGTSRITYRAGDIRGVTGWANGELDRELDWSPYYADPTISRTQPALTALREGTSSVHFSLRQPDGGARPMVATLERLAERPDGGGEVVGYVRDDTAEQQAAAREAELRMELERTLALAPVVVFRARISANADSDWQAGTGRYRTDFVSMSLERVTGWTHAALDAAGGLPAILSPWDTMGCGVQAMQRDGHWGGDFQMRRPDGEEITVRITTSVVTHHFDGMDIVGYIADVTGERDAKARAIGSARLASLGELAAGLAHELKQPLQAIELGVSNAQSAAKRGNFGAVEQRLERISAYSRRAAGVVEHLRRLARGGDETAAPEPMVLEELVAAVLNMLAGPLRDGGVQVVQEFEAHPLVALGHPVALEQVMTNLLINARDALSHLPQDTARVVTLRAASTPDGQSVVLTVSDNGGGIPAKVMERLFQPFVTTKGLERGTGLGLSICQGLVQHMGGTIAATNDRKGAVFTITLPAAMVTPTGQQTERAAA